jgi:ribosomal protein L7/L12
LTIFISSQYRDRRNKQSNLTEIKRRAASGQAPFGCSEQLANYVKAGQKIQAIKLYREEYGVGLRDAKNAVDRFSADLGNVGQASLPDDLR